MRNKVKTKINRIIELADDLPCFTLDDLSPLEGNKSYLKNLLSRYEKLGKVIRLKKGFFVTRRYVDLKGNGLDLTTYLEFLANFLRQPSYLSLEYMLDKYGMLTDAPFSYTSVTKRKTKQFKNVLGNFLYRKIRDNLYTGFKISEKNGFTIFEATKAKALFDFLYLRKNELLDKSAVEELRLNLEELNKGDVREFKSYVNLDGSVKMSKIANYIFELL